ncbi:uncharacterized protein LOC128963407 [Oppia nitens]|uniref:uncharacterized protein LOC128963407 n=1 Tax=Oppia nitens TaxID=1686743 RepID=UPI0023DB5D6A|nr:uncharacterized protein LOC128963407 [Oppia nitens]
MNDNNNSKDFVQNYVYSVIICIYIIIIIIFGLIARFGRNCYIREICDTCDGIELKTFKSSNYYNDVINSPSISVDINVNDKKLMEMIDIAVQTDPLAPIKRYIKKPQRVYAIVHV